MKTQSELSILSTKSLSYPLLLVISPKKTVFPFFLFFSEDECVCVCV